MAEYSRLARGMFTSAGAGVYINLPFQPTRVEFRNATASSTPAQNLVSFAFWDAYMAQGTANVEYISAASSPWATGADFVATGGISTFSAGIALQFGPQQQIIGATAANPIVFNVAAHGLNVGDVVVFEGLYQSATTGMPQIAGMPFVISAVSDANHFAVVWPGGGGNYTALSGSPAGAYVRKVLYPFLYEPGVAFLEAIAVDPTTTVNTLITTTAPHNFFVGQQVAFRIPSLWGTTQLNSLPNNSIPGQPIYYYVTRVVSNTQFVCNAVFANLAVFNTNIPVASVPGLSFPQVVAVGDINSGGMRYTGGNLYPSPVIPTFVGNSTINGPAIQGAFINNTSAGFTIGNGAGTVDTSAVLLGTGNLIIWSAYLFDYNNP